MTQIAKVSLAVLVGSTLLIGSVNQMKLYGVKSGKVEYKIKGSGEIMGSRMQTVGKKRVIFDTYGAQNLTEENKVDKQVVMGKAITKQTHTMTYMKGATVYHVNFGHRRIMRMANMGVAMGALMGGNNMKQTGEEMMKKMGGKKTGTDNVLGYTCDVWEMMGVKQCIYEGIPLRVETNVMGVKTVEIATKAEFDISLSRNDFRLPDFPVYGEGGKILDKSKLDAMDKRAESEMTQKRDNVTGMRNAMTTAMRDAGIKEGQKPTKVQEKKMEESMGNAIFPRIKKQILAKGKALRFGRECLGKANTLKEANICTDKVNAMGGEPEEYFEEWSPASKKKMLGFMDQGIENMKCIEKAQNMQDMQQCMPHE